MSQWIGLVGTNGAGKSVVCDYLAKTHGFDVISLSDMIRDEATRLGRAHTRDNLTAIGNRLKAEGGAAVLASRAVEKAKNLGSRVVFDSVRNAEEVRTLKESSAHMIGIDADIQLRYTRVQERGKETDNVDFETFKAQDERERDGSSSGQNIGACWPLCDHVIDNSTTYNALTDQIDELINGY